MMRSVPFPRVTSALTMISSQSSICDHRHDILIITISIISFNISSLSRHHHRVIIQKVTFLTGTLVFLQTHSTDEDAKRTHSKAVGSRVEMTTNAPAGMPGPGPGGPGEVPGMMLQVACLRCGLSAFSAEQRFIYFLRFSHRI